MMKSQARSWMPHAETSPHSFNTKLIAAWVLNQQNCIYEIGCNFSRKPELREFDLRI